MKDLEIPYRVHKPVYEEFIVKVPKFIDTPIKMPTGYDAVINEIALEISTGLYNKIESMIKEKLDKALDSRFKEIEVPKVIYREEVVKHDIHVNNAIVKDVHVNNAVVTNVPINNPIPVDVPYNNAVVKDIEVINAVITQVPVTHCVIVDKIIEVPKEA